MTYDEWKKGILKNEPPPESSQKYCLGLTGLAHLQAGETIFINKQYDYIVGASNLAEALIPGTVTWKVANRILVVRTATIAAVAFMLGLLF